MKNGLLVYQTNPECNIFNIGDYIQSLAARQFLNNEDIVYLNRERLDLYDQEEVKLILNGWFMHSPDHWPPSKLISPLFVAFHLNSSVKDKLLNEDGIQYFKEHQPIGCRDQYTVSLLRNEGVDAFFSGCLTLTLGMTYKCKYARSQKIYFVDAPDLHGMSFRFLFRGLYVILCRLEKLNKIYKKRYDTFSIVNYLKNLSFVEKYSRLFSMDVLESAEYIEHEIKDTFSTDEDKFRYAEELLDKYASAKYIVTSRIHCALPCLGLETPVLYVYNTEQEEISNCRMGGLLELFHLVKINRKDITSSLNIGQITVDTEFENKDTYKKYRDKLVSICNDFMSDAK